MSTGEKIRSLRKSLGWTQEQFAEKLDISRATVSKYESGTIIPTSQMCGKICAVTGCSLSDIVEDSSNSSDEQLFHAADLLQELFAVEGNASEAIGALALNVINQSFERLNIAGKLEVARYASGLTLKPEYQKEGLDDAVDTQKDE